MVNGMQTQFLLTSRFIVCRSAVALLALNLLVACQSAAQPTPTATRNAETLVYCAWPSYMPQTVLNAFTAESGIKVDYQTYGSQKEGIAQMKAGKVCDVVVIDNDLIP